MTRDRIVEVVFDGGSRFVATTGTGRSLVFGDRPEENEHSPVESIVASLAGCAGMDVISIATKKRQAIERYEIHAVGDQRDEYPQVLTEVVVTHEVWGRDLAEAAIRRAIELSATKYCPVNAMVSAGATSVSHRYVDPLHGCIAVRGAGRSRGHRTLSPSGDHPDRRSDYLLVSRSALSDMLGFPHKTPGAPMPNAVPADAATRLPKARMIDPRGHRFGAGVSAGLLVIAVLTASPWLVAPVLLSIGSSAALGLRYSIYGAIWRRIVKVAGLGPVEPEHEYPPRFAQVLGSVALIAALLAFAVGAALLGWLLVLGVASLQTLLATTGYCLGCRLYFLRWWVPDVFTRIWTRGSGSTGKLAVEPISYK